MPYLRSHIPEDHSLWSACNVVFQSSEGFMLVGTKEGLYRYDGTRSELIAFQDTSTGLLLGRALRKSLHYLGILLLTGLLLTGAVFLCALVFALEEPLLNMVAVLGMFAAVLALLAMCSLASAAQALEGKGWRPP